jgi:Tfp pilus assembly protein PilV
LVPLKDLFGYGQFETFPLALPSKRTTLILRPFCKQLPSSKTLLPDQKLKSAQGFTIMEVGLAATVLALTLTGMIGVIESGSQMLDLSRKQTLAAQILHSEIDQLRLQSWMAVAGEIPAGTTSVSGTFYSSTQVGYSGTPALLVTPGNGYPSGPTTLTASNDPSFAAFVASYPQVASNFTLTRTVSCIEPAQTNQNPTPYTTPPNLIQVTFTIQWKGISGRSYSRSATTLVGSNGLSIAYQRS